MISQVNEAINKTCEENGFHLASNGNILRKHFCKSGVHLSDEGTKHNSPRDVEDLFVELNFRKSKWLLFGTYHTPAQNDLYFLKLYR